MAPQQQYNSDAVELQATHFPRRNEASYAWGNVMGIHSQIPYLRGLWNFASRNETPNFYDFSGQGRVLTNTNLCPTQLYSLAPYVLMNGTGGILRADEAGLDILSNLSLGGWFWFNFKATSPACLGKWNSVGNQRSYLIYLDNGSSMVRFDISTLGTAASVTTQWFNTKLVALNTWNHIVGTFAANSEIALYLNGEKLSTAIPAVGAIFNSTAPFEIGAINGSASQWLTGSTAYDWVAAYTLPEYYVKELYELSRPLFGV